MTDHHSDLAAQWARENVPCTCVAKLCDDLQPPSFVNHNDCPAHYRPVIAEALARAWRERDNAEKWHQVWKQEAEMLNKQPTDIRAPGDTP